MKHKTKKTKTDLLFELLQIQKAISNLQFSLINNDFEEENSQYYINELILTINDSYSELKKFKKTI